MVQDKVLYLSISTIGLSLEHQLKVTIEWIYYYTLYIQIKVCTMGFNWFIFINSITVQNSF